MRCGEVYRFRAPKGVSHEQQGVRYAIVVQADKLLPRSVVIIAPRATVAMSRADRTTRTIAGVLLTGVGLVTGPSWLLVALGVMILAWVGAGGVVALRS